MEEVTAEINVIKAILAYRTKYLDNSPEERLEKLKERFPDNDSLFTYIRFPEERLQILLEELQKEKNILHELKAKQLGSSTGNGYSDFVVWG